MTRAETPWAHGDLAGQLLEPVPAAGDENQVVPFLGDEPRELPPDAARSSRDERVSGRAAAPHGAKGYMAERPGFEPGVGLLALRRFSKPLV